MRKSRGNPTVNLCLSSHDNSRFFYRVKWSEGSHEKDGAYDWNVKKKRFAFDFLIFDKILKPLSGQSQQG